MTQTSILYVSPELYEELRKHMAESGHAYRFCDDVVGGERIEMTGIVVKPRYPDPLPLSPEIKATIDHLNKEIARLNAEMALCPDANGGTDGFSTIENLEPPNAKCLFCLEHDAEMPGGLCLDCGKAWFTLP